MQIFEPLILNLSKGTDSGTAHQEVGIGPLNESPMPLEQSTAIIHRHFISRRRAQPNRASTVTAGAIGNPTCPGCPSQGQPGKIHYSWTVVRLVSSSGVTASLFAAKKSM